eukprot:9585455-Alexandrium_andersonii.AAC.1
MVSVPLRDPSTTTQAHSTALGDPSATPQGPLCSDMACQLVPVDPLALCDVRELLGCAQAAAVVAASVAVAAVVAAVSVAVAAAVAPAAAAPVCPVAAASARAT